MSTSQPQPPDEVETLKAQLGLHQTIITSLKAQHEAAMAELAAQNKSLREQIGDSHKIRVTLKDGSVVMYRGDAFAIMDNPKRVEFRAVNKQAGTYSVIGFRPWDDIADVSVPPS